MAQLGILSPIFCQFLILSFVSGVSWVQTRHIRNPYHMQMLWKDIHSMRGAVQQVQKRQGLKLIVRKNESADKLQQR